VDLSLFALVSAAVALLQGAAETSTSIFPGRLREVTVLIRAAFLLFLGLPLVYGLSKGIRGWVTRNSTPQRGMIIGKLIFYVGVAIILVSTMTELGFSLAPLLGAAGILGIALGFASQTSVSNVISGFFLMAEQPFVVDDVIQVGATTGRVLSIDMMSVKLRTFDNRFVRIPNETIVKSEVVTVTRFPIRRLDTVVGVAYKEDIRVVRELLLDVAARNPLALMEPEPLVIFQGYGESSIDFLFAVWTTRENFLPLRNSISEEVKRRFDEEGIEIPFPHRTLYVGSETGPLTVQVIGDGRGGGSGGSGGSALPGDPAGDAVD
jgi:small-conductance mechanosensitive channel